MTYLRMRNSHRTQPGLAHSKASAEVSIEIQPAQEFLLRVAAVTSKPRRLQVDPAISEGPGLRRAARIGTLHKPMHGA